MAFNPAGRPKTLGRYDLAVEVGRSPLGLGYIALREEEPRVGFLRLIDTSAGPKDARDELSEAAWWAQDLRHPHVFSTRDVVLDEARLGIVSDYVEGEPLRNLLRLSAFKKQPATLPVALAIALDAAEGARALAANATPLSRGSISYGNLTCDGVHVGVDGVVRLVDPGLLAKARSLKSFSSSVELAQYAAPELHRGQPCDEKSDVFALGVLLWELLSGGKHLFIGASVAALAERITERNVPRLERGATGKLPPEVTDLVARTLHREPGERYASLTELTTALTACGERATPEALGQWMQGLGGTAIALRTKQLEKALVSPVVATASRSEGARLPLGLGRAKSAAQPLPAPPPAPVARSVPPPPPRPIPSSVPPPPTRLVPSASAPTPAVRSSFESAPDDLLEELEPAVDDELEMEVLAEKPAAAPIDLAAKLDPVDVEEEQVDVERKQAAPAPNPFQTGASPSPGPTLGSLTPTALPALAPSVAPPRPIQPAVSTPAPLPTIPFPQATGGLESPKPASGEARGASIPPPPLLDPGPRFGRAALLGGLGLAVALVGAWAWLRPAPSHTQISASTVDAAATELRVTDEARGERPAPAPPSASSANVVSPPPPTEAAPPSAVTSAPATTAKAALVPATKSATPKTASPTTKTATATKATSTKTATSKTATTTAKKTLVAPAKTTTAKTTTKGKTTATTTKAKTTTTKAAGK